MFTFIENSRLYKNHLIKKYKPHITPKINSQEEIIALLEQEFDLVRACVDDIEPIFWKIGVLFNLEEYNTDSYEFEILKIKRNEKSESFYQYFLKWDEISDDENIFVIFEKNTDFMTTKCNKLIAKMILLKGVSQYDYYST